MNDQVPQPPDTSEEELRQRAEARVEERSHLLQHIGTYIIINGFLVVVWALSGRGYPWFLWVMAGWGIGLAAHIIGYFTGTRGQAARDRMVAKEMERMKKKSQ
jgi:hypothetical protein